MKKAKYYDINPILKTESLWNIIMGGRNSGKSFQIKKYFIDGAMNGVEFLYLRRYQDDMDTSAIIEYFNDIVNNRDGKNYLEIWTKGKYNDVRAGQRKIWFIKRDDETGERDEKTKPFLVGHYGAISKSQSFKSRENANIGNILYEEFIPDGTPLLPNEPHLLESIISSIARSSRDVKVFLIGNNITRTFFYFRYWGLNKVMKQKINTIDIYNFENGDYNEDGTPVTIRFAVELVPDFDGKKGMFFGRAVELNSSEWKAQKQPYIHQKELEDYDKVYQVFFIFQGLKWKGELYRGKNYELFWYIEPCTKDINIDERVISDHVDINPLHSINLRPINKFEQIGFQALQDGKAFFSDSLCGTEFKRAIAQFLVSDITTGLNEL